MFRKWYDAVWLVDTEFREPDGDLPIIRCLVARERFTGETIRLWADELARLKRPPFDIGNQEQEISKGLSPGGNRHNS